jgi:hypothetical protein
MKKQKTYSVSLAVKVPHNFNVNVEAKSEAEAIRKAVKYFQSVNDWNDHLSNNVNYDWKDVESAFDVENNAGIAVEENEDATDLIDSAFFAKIAN